ncbi:bromodomain containing 1 [Ophiostoma piceae UAMH 11346]|uniref:Bromodomain containing 1 n=1 Tax=Ophiostoma piceae (strain UAMH 11346) TaxID=1262450 RepID=S3BVP1_OPHP1|nr:bromodomain containing 1 [Ophiostoma piceae UAMH 11346]
MATPLTPRRGTTGRRRGRPPGSTNAARAARLAAVSSEPPPKRRKYVPGGPGGGGRFIDEDGTVTHVVRGVGGRGGSSARGRTPATTGRGHRTSMLSARTSSPLPRRERSTRTRIAVSRYEPDDEEHEGYKPREERGWEEFHPNLDIETTFMVFRSEEVDGTAKPAYNAIIPATNYATNSASSSSFMTLTAGLSFSTSTAASSFANGTTDVAADISSKDAAAAEPTTGGSVVTFTAGSGSTQIDTAAPTLHDSAVTGFLDPNGTLPPVTSDLAHANNTDTITNISTPTLPETPLRRRIGRPPRDGVVVSYGGTGTTPKTPKVLPIHNQTPKEKLDLKLPSYRRTDRILMFENKTLSRYVDKSMMNVGYQETDVYIRPDRFLLKASDANAEEEVDAYHTAAAAAEAAAAEVAAPGSVEHSQSQTKNAKSLITNTTDLPTSYGVPGSAVNFIISGGGAGSNGGVGRVEYDMDEQDDMWLAKYNAQRKAVNVEPITREIFEITITKIEKEWHLLEKRIPKPNPKPPQTHRARSSSAVAVNGEMQIGEEQDSKCAICDDGDCENTNAIVFCDGCDLAVHQDCYGVPFIPEGQWLCRKCQLIGRGVPTCIFCPNTDGAFKQTNSSKWAHMLCAMWIPETSLGNTTFMEPVMDVDKVPKTRWRLTCYICRQKMGACIQCGNKACYQAFHVTCARRARLYLKMKNSQGALAVLDNSMILKAFCDRHCPPEYAKENAVHQATREAKRHYKRTMRGRIWADSRASALQMAATTHGMIGVGHAAAESQMTGAPAVAGSGSDAAGAVDASALALTDKIKNASAAKPMWKLPSGAPVIPQAVFDIVETALQRFMLRRRREFVSEACRYWTLKREARRGAALLKRLQLQMETFTSMELTRRNFATMGASGQARLERRIEFAEGLIRDLEQLRSLSNDVVERERDKLEAATLEHDFVNSCYFPVYKLLAPVIDKASTYDKGIFKNGFAGLQDKLNTRFYTTSLAFVHDLADTVHKIINQADDDVDADVVTDDIGAKSGGGGGGSSYVEARDRKRLGKRILKSIQPMLEAAVRAEADITRTPLEPLQKELEQLLESCVEVQQVAKPKQQPASIHVSPAADDVVMAEGDGQIVVSHDFKEGEADAEADAEGEADDKMDVDESRDDARTTPRASRHKTISIQITTPRSSTTVLANGTNGTNGAGAVTESANGVDDGSKSAATTTTDAPLTPPQSHNGSLPGASSSSDARPSVDTLDAGGVLWYLHGFSPKGTTTADEPLWSGAGGAEANGDGTSTPVDGTASRLLSEDLTDMDDEELKGLEFDVEDSTITAAPSSTGKNAAKPTNQNLMVTTPRRGRAGAHHRKGVRTSSRRR